MHSHDKVCDLNDSFRQTFGGGRVVVTAGIADRPDLGGILDHVKRFTDFTHANDPHGEHDFGAFDHEGEKLFWKIDYYNRTLTAGSSNPADETITTRVLTIILAREY